MNLAAAIELYGGGPGSGCNPDVAQPKCGRPPGDSTQEAVHVPDVAPKPKRDWRRKQFETTTEGGYFRKGTFVDKVFKELQANPNTWFDIKALMDRHGGKSFHGALFSLRDVAKNIGKFTIEKNNDMNTIRLVPKVPVGSPSVARREGALGEPVVGVAAVEQKLSSSPVDKVKNIREGAELGEKRAPGNETDTHVLTLHGGGLAGFKAESGNTKTSLSDQTESEMIAWEINKVVGNTDIASPMVYRKVQITPERKDYKSQESYAQAVDYWRKPRWGVAWDWIDGTPAIDVGEDDKKFDGDRDAARIGVFDYVIMNTDRHDGNWMVAPNGKLKMIDHGFSLWENGFHMNENESFVNNRPKAEITPDIIAPYREHKEEIRAILKKYGKRDKSIDGVMYRIDELSQMKTLGDLNGRVMEG